MKRFLPLIVIALIAIFLAACGGGGGSSPTVLPAASAPNVTVESFKAAPVRATATVALEFNSKMKPLAVAAAPTAGPFGGVDATAAADQLLAFGEAAYAQYFPGQKKPESWAEWRYAYYPETGTYLGVNVRGTPDLVLGGVYVMGGPFGSSPMYVGRLTDYITPRVPLVYTDKVYALWTEKYPHAVTKSGVTRVVNMTGRPRIAFCLIADRAEVSGIILTLCKDFDAQQWLACYIEPLKEELHEYTGPLRPELAFTPTADGNRVNLPEGTRWLDVGLPDGTFPDWGTYAPVEDGWYFVTNFNRMALRFQERSGSTLTVKEGSFSVEGSVRLLSSYSSRDRVQ